MCGGISGVARLGSPGSGPPPTFFQTWYCNSCKFDEFLLCVGGVWLGVVTGVNSKGNSLASWTPPTFFTLATPLPGYDVKPPGCLHPNEFSRLDAEGHQSVKTRHTKAHVADGKVIAHACMDISVCQLTLRRNDDNDYHSIRSSTPHFLI